MRAGGASTDGKTWGHSWISVLGLERMMHGVRAIRDHLTDEDLATMQRVLVSEADWLLDHYPVTAGLIQNNHPHADGLWQVVRTCTFPDGRLWRIGGDSRVRYCYCQDYAIPVWMFAQDRFGDRAARVFEERWLDQVEALRA
jgi:hypothetical protein